MTKLYGKREGLRIFREKADLYGKGRSIVERANSVYSKGTHRVKVSRKRPKPGK